MHVVGRHYPDIGRSFVSQPSASQETSCGEIPQRKANLFMLEFRPITIEDKDLVERYLALRNRIECNRNFATLFMWAKIYDQQLCEQDGWLFIKSSDAFYHPMGEGDLRVAIDAMVEYCRQQDKKLIIWGNNPNERKELEELYPKEFEFVEMRDFYDYAYDAQKMASLAGKKLHGKRNHINRFVQDNPGWSFEPLTEENLDEALEMNRKWCEFNDCKKSEGLRDESCAVRRCFKYFKELGLVGGLLRTPEHGVVAYSMASLLGTHAVDVHIEKAFSNIQGAYPMINREMVRYLLTLYPHITLINREDDTGDEGLRKAKLSYYPELLVEKSTATWIGD